MTTPRDEDAAARRLSEALHAQAASGARVPPRAAGSDRPAPAPARFGPPTPPPRMPGRVPPPAPRPVAAPQAPAPAGSTGRQIVWALVITLLVGAVLGGGIGLVSVLLPGALPAFG